MLKEQNLIWLNLGSLMKYLISMELEKEKNKDAIKIAWATLESKVRKNKHGGGKVRLKELEKKGLKL